MHQVTTARSAYRHLPFKYENLLALKFLPSITPPEWALHRRLIGLLAGLDVGMFFSLRDKHLDLVGLLVIGTLLQ